MGGSYGGYATLAGVAFTPDCLRGRRVHRRAVEPDHPDGVHSALLGGGAQGVRRAHGRRIDAGGQEAARERQSPLNAAAKIRTPLLVIQGANDPRVNKRESDQIVVALRDRGFPVEYIVAPDEGHGFARPVNNMAAYAAAEKFLSKFLGGRYQETMTPEVATRLKDITVDPKTVTVAKPVEAAAVGMPKPSRFAAGRDVAIQGEGRDARAGDADGRDDRDQGVARWMARYRTPRRRPRARSPTARRWTRRRSRCGSARSSRGR